MRTLQILLVLLEILDYAQSASFDDVSLQIDPGNRLIEATLYDQSNDERYSMRELIYSNYSISGKIAITSDAGSFDIFYHDRLQDYRLVIHDNRCDTFTYKSKWDSNLPGITNPLLNRILLVGPSLIHRLNWGAHRWISDSDVQIRGTTMHSDYANMNGNKLRVTRYFKNKEAIQPDRIVFYGTDVTEFSSKKQSFIMDFTSFTKLENEVSSLVTITPGIGCRFYLASPSPIPNVPSNQLHYLLDENVKGPRPSSKREEVYADIEAQLLYRKMTSQRKEEKTIYDFSLGISYKLLNKGYCTIAPMASSDPGVEVTYMKSSMSLNLLLNEIPNDKFKFLGIKAIEEQNGHGKYYVYEAVEYNKTTKSGTYDKVVTTNYYIFASIDLGHYYTLRSSVINAYKKSDSDSYNLIETTQRNYYDYGVKISGEMYGSIFNIGSCYDSKLKETFALNFKCRSSKESCDFFGQKMPYSYNDRLKESIVNTGTISASRIVNIDVFFNQNETTAYVTFNELPPLKNVFRNESISVAKKVLKKSLEVSVGSSDECLHLYTKRATTFEGVAFCENKICASIDKINDLVEDKVDGYDCEIFYVPLKNLNRYDRELSSDAIQRGLISRGLSFSLYDGVSLAQYTIASITKVSNEIEKLFSPLYAGYKLPGNNIKVQLVREVENLGDCSHACAKSDGCQTFSVCSYSGQFDCLVSTFDSATLSTDLLSPDESCTVYRRDLVHNYNPIFNRRYKDSGSIVADTHLDNCALLCHQSSECYSFQFCQRQCSFAGIYTDSATEYHQNCSVYIPKVSDKFIYTGHKIVSETHHTELNLTMNQCAALCDAWKAGNEPCLSFNYCPEGKTETVCSLSKSSAKNPSTRSVVSEKCTNYEYKDAEKLDSNPKMDQVKATSGKTALGIITLFMIVGLVAGITTPIAYRKIKTFKILDTSFKLDHSLDEE